MEEGWKAELFWVELSWFCSD